jgi:hypothetical protein
MKAFSFIFIFLSFSCSISFAQSTNELDKKYRPKEGSSKELSAETNTAPRENGIIKNALYFEPLLLSRGNVALTYEREISKIGISLVGTLGYNIFPDYVTLSTLKEDMFLGGTYSNNPSTLSSSDYFSKASQDGGGLFFQGSARIFLREYFGDLDGSGLEMIYRRSSQNFIIPGNGTNTQENFITYPKAQIDPVTYTSFVVAFRSQTVGTGRRPFIHGLTYGIGIRQVKFPSYTYTDTTDQFGNYRQVINRSSDKFETTQGFTLMFNYSLGFGW